MEAALFVVLFLVMISGLLADLDGSRRKAARAKRPRGA